MHAHTHTHIYTHARTHAHTHARTHAHTHAHTRARTHARTHAIFPLPFARVSYRVVCLLDARGRQLRADAAARDSELRTVRAEIQSLPQIGSVDADLRTCYAEQRQKQLSIEKMKGVKALHNPGGGEGGQRA
eukprot:3255051-Pleurochrysis_carterae.AAC.1